MRIEIVEKKVYNFDDLIREENEKILEKILEKWDDGFISDFIIEDETETLDILGYENVKIYFSGFYSQGDGACFIADVDIEKIIKRHDLKIKYNLYDFFINQLSDKKIIHTGNYYHYNSINFDGYYCSSNYKKIDNYLKNVFLELEKIINDEIKDISKNIYRRLEGEYEYQKSKDCILDCIQANDYEFYENGQMV